LIFVDFGRKIKFSNIEREKSTAEPIKLIGPNVPIELLKLTTLIRKSNVPTMINIVINILRDELKID
jgi:hypothetical protein